MALADKIKIIPAKSWATFSATSAALFTSVDVGHISKATQQKNHLIKPPDLP